MSTLTLPSRPRPASALSTAGIFIHRSILQNLRTTDALVMSIVLPVMLMLLFTYVFGGALDPSGEYVTYVVPGIILLCAGFGSASTAVDVASDMTTGVIDRFRSMPIPASMILTGHVVASLVRNLLATTVVVIVAVLVGFRPTANLLEWCVAIGLIAGYILAITWLCAAIGLVVKNVEAASNATFVFLFVPYLSSAFVPVETMPPFLRAFAENQPITPITETIREALTGTDGGNLPLAVGWILLILIGSWIWATWLFRRRGRK
jgi:ABC-2 type transport system permease protein